MPEIGATITIPTQLLDTTAIPEMCYICHCNMNVVQNSLRLTKSALDYSERPKKLAHFVLYAFTSSNID